MVRLTGFSNFLGRPLSLFTPRLMQEGSLDGHGLKALKKNERFGAKSILPKHVFSLLIFLHITFNVV